MNELKIIDNEFQKIKEQRFGGKKDLKNCYQHAQEIDNLIKRIKNINEEVIQQKKPELIKIYKKKGYKSPNPKLENESLIKAL